MHFSIEIDEKSPRVAYLTKKYSCGRIAIQPQRVRAAAAAAQHGYPVQAAVATQQEQAASGGKAMDPAVWKNKRKADGEHPEDLERQDGTWMRTEGRKRVEEEEESMLEKTLEAPEDVGESRGKQGV